jgi:hypothetical protein
MTAFPAPAAPIASIDELKTFLAGLPPPEEGTIRVYRGQNRDFGKLLSTAHRSGGPVPGRDLWGYYTMHLVEDLKALSKENVETLDMLVFWVHAISQHYGPGTDYLDVTHSLETALWFAFRKFTRVQQRGVSGKGEELNKDDIITLHEFVRYDDWPEDAWLYVLDLPKAENILGREHGNVIDILDGAPAIFKKSGRIKAQQACLAFCSQHTDGGDLWKMRVCDPIPLKAGIAEGMLAELTTKVLFPSPAEDEWYHRFLQVPYSYCGYTQSGNLAAQKSIPVEMYIEKPDSTDPYFVDLLQSILTITPLLMYPVYETKDDREKEELAAATPVALLYPLLFNSPPVSSGDWQEGVLWFNLFAATAEEIAATGNGGVAAAGGAELLHNFFFEFSAAELGSWFEIDQQEGEAIWKRSIWFRAYRDNTVKVTMTVQVFPGCQMGTGEYTIAFDRGNGKLLSWTRGVATPDLLTNNELLCKILYVVMTIIGDIGPGIKLKPLPLLSTVSGDEKTFLVVGTDTTAFLKKGLLLPFSSKLYYNLYHRETGLPYKQSAETLSRGFTQKIKWEGMFCDMPLDVLYANFPPQVRRPG